jgi:hypothetical protein
MMHAFGIDTGIGISNGTGVLTLIFVRYIYIIHQHNYLPANQLIVSRTALINLFTAVLFLLRLVPI